MAPSATSSPTKRLIKPACFAICLLFLILASRGLFTGYSYWLDELYSVSASIDSWPQLYQRWILKDVHPPLYQVILKLWISPFGSSEVATRLLSFIFSIATLSAFSLDAIASKRWRRVTALVLIGASPSFAYYAQETRSYAMVLALSSVVTLSILALRSRIKGAEHSQDTILGFVYHAGALLLSLTHYFGWIYVFVISLISFFEQRFKHARQSSVLLMIAISAWPAWHLIAGTLGSRTGGDFWIKVSPPLTGTIRIFLEGSLPFLADNGSPSRFIVAWSLITALILIAARSWDAIRAFFATDPNRSGTIADESKFVLLSIALVVGALSLVDLHTPMSTTRNYIVLLPPVMIALADSLTMLVNMRGLRSPAGVASSFLAILIVLMLAKQSWGGLTAKIQPHQNWKALSAYVRGSGICSHGCFALGSSGLHHYYFWGSGRIDDLSIPKETMRSPQIKPSLDSQSQSISLLQDAKILGFHRAWEKIAELLESGKDRECLQPSQSWENSTFIILPKSDLTGNEEKYGLKKCAPTK